MNLLRILFLAIAVLTGLTPAAGSETLPRVDRELVAGISTRDALTGGLVIAGSALVVGAVTGSTATAAGLAIALTTVFVIFEPLTARFAPKAAVPTMPELRRAQ